METDSLEVTNLWGTRHDYRSVVAPITLEIGELCASFNSFVICYNVRSTNGPAHIGKHTCTIDMTKSWIDNTPSFLISNLLADYSTNAFIQ
ncbi:hypothetical protein ZWY2020_027232 [Hordeum vulgare]|nr:hypothetical protein ZWY2020_027232 [Hordeum vulgare]